MKILSLKRMGLLGRKRQVDEMTRRTAQEDEPLNTSTLVLPPGNSLSFFTRKSVLEYDVERHRATSEQLTDVISSIETREDAMMVSSIVKTWFASPDTLDWDAKVRTSEIAGRLQKNGLDVELFGLLCDRWGHRLKPTRETIDGLMEYYEGVYADGKDIEALDCMYKVYTLYVFYDLLPGVEVYERLIRAGVKGGDEEGIRRSVETMKEMAALGMAISNETKTMVDECGGMMNVE